MDKCTIDTWEELRVHLNQLAMEGDDRLQDNLSIYSMDAEWYPAQLLEHMGDDVLDDGHLFLCVKEWGETFDESY